MYKNRWILHRVRETLLDGAIFTAKELGFRLQSQDIRKVISVLRNEEGWHIKDERLPTGCKRYWLEVSQREELRQRYNYKSNDNNGKE